MFVALGTISYVNVAKLSDCVKVLSEDALPNTKLIMQMRKDLLSIEKNLAVALASNERSVVQTYIDSANSDRQRLVDSINEFKTVSHADSKLMDDFEKYINDAAPIRKQIASYILTFDKDNIDRALSLFITTYIPTFENASQVLTQISNNEDISSSDQISSANNTIVSSELITLIMPIIAVILSMFIVVIITKSISGPVIAAGKAAKEITQGNLSVNLRVEGNDEVGELVQSLIMLRDTVLSLTNSLNTMSHEISKGDIEARIDESIFMGEYKDVAVSINSTVDALVNDTLKILAGFNEFGEGNFAYNLEQFPGKKALANEQFNTLKNNLVTLNKDVNNLIQGAIKGKLDTRVNADLYKGDWNKLTNGLNNLLQSVSTPIDEANAILDRIAVGDFDIAVNNNYQGSFANMMKCFDKMITSIRSYIGEITEVLGLIANKDLTSGISRDYDGQFNLIKISVNNISETLRNTIAEIKVSADNVLGGATQISESSMDLANGASSQASSVEELNASILTINEQTRKTAEDAQTAHEYSIKSMENATTGNNEMLKMLDSMEGIKDASNNISKIIKVIDDIAFQTNILALNAAVEAARAGAAGKGFAVVAEEVRSLAGRSQQAAKDTSILIEDTIDKIGDGTRTAELTAQSLKKIVDDTNSVSTIINSIYNSTKEQSDGISQITVGINQIAEVVQRNSATSEESAAAAEELNSQSVLLAEMVSDFNI